MELEDKVLADKTDESKKENLVDFLTDFGFRNENEIVSSYSRRLVGCEARARQFELPESYLLVDTVPYSQDYYKLNLWIPESKIRSIFLS